jgi:hypothetical protein
MQIIIQSFVNIKYSQPLVQNDEVDQSGVCLLHDKARLYNTAVTTATLEEVQCDSKLLSGFPWPIIFKPETTK